jgi:hypothetical protein
LFSPVLDHSGYTSSTLVGPAWHSPSSYTSSTNNEHSSDNKNLTNGHHSLNNNSMTNGYNTSAKSRSCENNLDICGRKVYDELAISSSSLIDLPPPSVSNHTDYDNLPVVNDHDQIDGEKPVMRVSTQSQSPISSELDQKIKDEIDARLRDIDDEYELNCKNIFIR